MLIYFQILIMPSHKHWMPSKNCGYNSIVLCLHHESLIRTKKVVVLREDLQKKKSSHLIKASLSDSCSCTGPGALTRERKIVGTAFESRDEGYPDLWKGAH